MEHYYLSAWEIKDATDAYVKDQDEIKLDEVYNKISSQVILGKYELTIYEQLSKANKDFLKIKGFEIHESPAQCCYSGSENRYEVFTTISWRNA